MSSADVAHVSKEGCLYAAGARLFHPERCLVLQGRPVWVEGEVHTGVGQTAEEGQAEVWEAHKAP